MGREAPAGGRECVCGGEREWVGECVCGGGEREWVGECEWVGERVGGRECVWECVCVRERVWELSG